MSAATIPADPDEQMLARLAQLDLAAAERVHERLMAAEAADEVADLGRTYQRLARSLRQTLALKAKLARDRLETTSHAGLRGLQIVSDLEGVRIDDRAEALQDAVERMAAAASVGDEERREALLDRFDVELDDWVHEDGFADADLDTQLRRACRLLELPEDLAADWRSLPRPVFTPDPATRDQATRDPEDAAQPPQPWSSSG